MLEMREELNIYQYLLTIVMLGIGTGTDIRCRRVSKRMAAVYLLLALCGHLAYGTLQAEKILPGLLPGAVCLMISFVSGEGLGYGDSVLIAVCGISLGLQDIMAVVCMAFALVSIWAAGLLLFRREGRKKEIPFVPFLLIAAVIQTAVVWMEIQ